ncbi:MAG: RNA methyltransferase [Chitinophagaceae bacterium]|nr:RNA methyltransferase [Oligoflexus sp.]
MDKDGGSIGMRRFLELNEGMALRQVLDQLHSVESVWMSEMPRTEAFAQLLELLSWCGLHRSEKVRELAQLSARIPEAPTYHQFMTLVAPIERAFGRGVTDPDIAARSLDRAEPMAKTLPFVLVVDNLRSAFNVGSIFRIAECFGVSHLHLCGYTATPEQDKLKKASMGTDTLQAWTWHPHVSDCLKALKASGYYIFALETSDTAQSLQVFEFPQGPTALVFGNERFGIEAHILELCDAVLEIPCQGRKNSLNVAVSLGVAAYEWRRQHTSGIAKLR